MSPFFIMDTHVMVAGLLTVHADSPVARLLDGMLRATFPFVVSRALLAKHHAALLRPRIAALHGMSAAEGEIILTDIARHVIVLPPDTPAAVTRAPDAGDQFRWDLRATRADLMLVTGDKSLLQDPAWGIGSSCRPRWRPDCNTDGCLPSTSSGQELFPIQ